MSSVWQNDEEGWRLLSSTGFPDEASLHNIVEKAPYVLPLAGNPDLVVVGREVLLGGNYADLLAVEPSGRLAVIEIKLAKNSEARRAVIAQILTYAAFLRNMSVETLEREILASHLGKRQYSSLADAVHSNSQDSDFDELAFLSDLRENLKAGHFRLVLVLDSAPDELVRLVGYLEAVAEKLTIDLVTVASFDIGGSQVVIPQRVEPDRFQVARQSSRVSESVDSGRLVEGIEDFEKSIDDASEKHRAFLKRLSEWARQLEQERLAKLFTYHGKSNMITLLPRLHQEGVGLVTIYNDLGTNDAYFQFWRSVIERRAPGHLNTIEGAAAPAKIGKGTITRDVSEDLLASLSAAYREAAQGKVKLISPPETP